STASRATSRKRRAQKVRACSARSHLPRANADGLREGRREMRVARLLFPGIRWDREHGWEPARQGIDEALALGVGGFCLFGGEAAAVGELTAELRARSRAPLLIASDLERGAGQQFTGATQLPPLAAIG